MSSRLETADLEHVDPRILQGTHAALSRLQIIQNQAGEGMADISTCDGIQARRFQQMIDQAGRSSLAVASGDGHHFSPPGHVLPPKLDLADHRQAFGPYRLHNFRFFRNTRALDNFSGIQDLIQRMPAFLIRNPRLFQFGFENGLDRAFVGHKYRIAQPFGQQGGACSGFAGAEDRYTFCLCHFT